MGPRGCRTRCSWPGRNRGEYLIDIAGGFALHVIDDLFQLAPVQRVLFSFEPFRQRLPGLMWIDDQHPFLLVTQALRDRFIDLSHLRTVKQMAGPIKRRGRDKKASVVRR